MDKYPAIMSLINERIENDKGTIKFLRDKIADLEKENAELKEANAKLEQENAELKLALMN